MSAPSLIKLAVGFLTALAVFFFFKEQILAQVVINEFAPNPENPPDWVELFNLTDEDINLDGWILRDEATSNMAEIKEATISAKGFYIVEVGSRLNKSKDTIFLQNDQGQVVDEYSYHENPGEGISLGRMPDGGDWGLCQTVTQGNANICVLPTSTPIPTSTPTPTPTKAPTNTPTDKPTSVPTSTSTPTLKPTATLALATDSGQVLGQTASEGAFYPLENKEASSSSVSAEDIEGETKPFWPWFILGSGAVFLFISAFLGYNRLK